MGVNPVPWILIIVAQTMLVSIVQSGTFEDPEAPEVDCDVFSLTPGCSTNIDNYILGTIDGAPSAINAALALLRLASVAMLIWAIVQLFRGV